MTPAELAARLAEEIWLGDVPAGGRLDPERRLAARFGVSRPTVRLALHRLAAAGVVRVILGRQGGAVVQPGAVPPAVLFPGAPTAPDVRSLLEARRALEPAIAWVAAARATAEDLDLLGRAVEEQRRARDGWAADLQRDARFHVLIARATHNATLERLGVQLQLDLYHVRFGALRAPHSPRLVADIHARTLAALRSRDRARLEEDLRDHLGWLERVAQPHGRRLSPGSISPAGRSDRAGVPPAPR